LSKLFPGTLRSRARCIASRSHHRRLDGDGRHRQRYCSAPRHRAASRAASQASTRRRGYTGCMELCPVCSFRLADPDGIGSIVVRSHRNFRDRNGANLAGGQKATQDDRRNRRLHKHDAALWPNTRCTVRPLTLADSQQQHHGFDEGAGDRRKRIRRPSRFQRPPFRYGQLRHGGHVEARGRLRSPQYRDGAYSISLDLDDAKPSRGTRRLVLRMQPATWSRWFQSVGRVLNEALTHADNARSGISAYVSVGFGPSSSIARRNGDCGYRQ
jgi:hypothetical protein